MIAHGSPLALPALAPAIPLELHIPGENDFAGPLAIALLEAGVVTDKMLAPGPNATLIEVLGEPDERELAMVALSRWWAGLIRRHSCEFFRWNLHVQRLSADTGHDYDVDTTAWFCFTRMGNRGIPRFALARRVGELEAVLEGFGQTVLAVLAETTAYLPETLTPWLAINWVEWLHWKDTKDDKELLELHRIENGYKTIQEVIDADEVLTRAEFYADMPEWVTAPRRVRSRDEIVRAARGGLEQDVIAACDAIAERVNRDDFVLRPEDKGVWRARLDIGDAAMVLLWRANDEVSRVLDDGMEYIYSGGESTDWIDANPVPMTAEGIRDFQTKTKQMLQLAVLAEQLVLLLGDPI